MVVSGLSRVGLAWQSVATLSRPAGKTDISAAPRRFLSLDCDGDKRPVACKRRTTVTHKLLF